jgi:hypothetical protein
MAKVPTDVDDTMANSPTIGIRGSPHGSPLPGVLEFFDALKREPFTIQGASMTTLSARNPLAAVLAEASIEKLTAYSEALDA